MRNIIRTIAPLLLILLFVYAACSKLMTFDTFRIQLYKQAFPHWMADILLYTLLPLELLIAGLLAFTRTRRSGLILSASLLLSFSAYIALTMLHYWDKVPCPCGGILNHMPWSMHLALNLGFAAIALAGFILTKNYKNNP